MPAQQLTNEDVREMIQEISRATKEQGADFDRRMKEQAAEFDRRMMEADRRIQETELQMKRTSKEVGKLTGTIGSMVEHMIGARILEKFQVLGYEVDYYTRNHFFSAKKRGIKGEIDLILHDGDISILIEVKTTLETADVRKHLEKIEKYRIYADARWNDPTRFIGAVAGAVVTDEAKDFAHENGMYVIVQSGEAVEIVPVPEGFQAREW